MKQLKITVSGRVQGVYFRKNTQNKANKLNLKGYVKNISDGTVEILAQGNEKQLLALLLWATKGNFPAKVTSIKSEWQKISTKYDDFRIIRAESIIKDQIHAYQNFTKLKSTKQNQKQTPKHIAIIPDGNRRWARAKGWHPWVGHQKALQNNELEKLFDTCIKRNITHLSLWVFSTENWSRDQKEIDMLFRLFEKFTKELSVNLKKRNIRFRHIGRKDRLPKKIINSLQNLEDESQNNTSFNFQLLMDYGGKDDIVRAMNKIIKNPPKEISEETIRANLDTHGLPDPDLIIRTSGEQRLSGLYSFENAYAELYFTDVNFPDFDNKELVKALENYSLRKRRFGGTHQKDIEGINKKNLTDPDKK